MANDKPIVIKDWQNGIADSPHLGLGLLKNVEVWSYPGAVRAGKKPITNFSPAYASTFTAVAATDVCTATSGVPNTTVAVQLTTTGTLPAGLALNTNYFVINLSPTTFKLASTVALANAGTGIDITDTGTGVHTMTVIAPGTINHFAKDPRTDTIFAIDSNGRVWYNEGSIFQLLGGNTLTNASGNGLAVFRNSDGSATYLFAYRNALVDVINVYGTADKETPNWSNGWKSLNTAAGSSSSHYSLVGQDNIIYFTDDRYVGSIAEKAGQIFDPANATTFTFNNQALTLPLGSLAYWMEQLGVNLLVSVSNDSYIYPWDRSSISFGLPVPIGEYGGNKMKNIGNVVYLLAGTRGNIYWTQGTYVRPFKTIPYYLLNTSISPTPNPITWGGIGAALGRLIVGVGASSGQSGVYMIDMNSVMTLDNYPSTGQAIVTALYAQTDFYYMGYAGGADVLDTQRYTSTECVIQSALMRIGTKTTKAKVSQIEIQIAVPLAGSINVSYRNNLTSAFTNVGSNPTFTTNTSNTSYQIDAGITDLENVQWQIQFDHGIDILEVRLNP